MTIKSTADMISEVRHHAVKARGQYERASGLFMKDLSFNPLEAIRTHTKKMAAAQTLHTEWERTERTFAHELETERRTKMVETADRLLPDTAAHVLAMMASDLREERERDIDSQSWSHRSTCPVDNLIGSLESGNRIAALKIIATQLMSIAGL